MSLDATTWAWRQKTNTPAQKLVLLSLADRAGEDHTCYPSIDRLVRDTQLNRKTVLGGLKALIEQGLIRDTGERKGSTRRVVAYQLVGVSSRHDQPENNTKNGTIPDEENGPGNGPIKPSQKRDDSKSGMVPETDGNSPKSGSGNSPKSGTQNQSVEPIREPERTSEPDGRTPDAPPDLTPPTEDQVLQLGIQCQPESEDRFIEDGKRWGTLEDTQLALWMGQQVDAFLEQDAPPRRNIATWANDIRLMRYQDKRELRHIKALFWWAHNDGFWRKNILSPGKLRDKWTELAAQRKEQREASNAARKSGGGSGGIDVTGAQW